MLRAIESFREDEQGDWIAELRCGHGQHVRHKPPFWSRPWVLTDAGRTAKLGVELPCVYCDRFEIPLGFAPYKRTPDFTAQSIPAALGREHSTKPGVWGRIHVLEGRLRYVVAPPLSHEAIHEAGSHAVIVAEVLHHVEPLGEVRFFVELLRRPPTDATGNPLP